MSSLGLQLIQKTPGENVMSIQGEQDGAETSNAEAPLDQWHLYFSKQFNNLFRRVGKIRNYKVPADIFEKINPTSTKMVTIKRRIPMKRRVSKKLQ